MCIICGGKRNGGTFCGETIHDRELFASGTLKDKTEAIIRGLEHEPESVRIIRLHVPGNGTVCLSRACGDTWHGFAHDSHDDGVCFSLNITYQHDTAEDAKTFARRAIRVLLRRERKTLAVA